MTWKDLDRGILEEFADAIGASKRDRSRIYGLDAWISGSFSFGERGRAGKVDAKRVEKATARRAADIERGARKASRAAERRSKVEAKRRRPKFISEKDANAIAIRQKITHSSAYRAVQRAAHAIAMGSKPAREDRRVLTLLVARLAKRDWYARNRATMLSIAAGRFAQLTREQCDERNRAGRERRRAVLADPMRRDAFLEAERARARRNIARYRATPGGRMKTLAAKRAYAARQRARVNADPERRAAYLEQKRAAYRASVHTCEGDTR